MKENNGEKKNAQKVATNNGKVMKHKCNQNNEQKMKENNKNNTVYKRCIKQGEMACKTFGRAY